MQPTKEKIKSFCNQQSYDRGVRYLRHGRVEKLKVKERSVKAKVRGTQLYEVRLDLDEPDFDAICTCPYDWGGYCKHIVATLLKLSEKDTEDFETSDEKRAERVEESLQQATGKELRNFLRREFKRNSKAERRFLLWFGESAEENQFENYKRELRELLDRASGDNYRRQVNKAIYSFFDMARGYHDQGQPKEAATIYKAVAEVIAEGTEPIDNFSGYQGDEFGLAINNYAESVVEAGMDFQEKKEHIDYLFEKYNEKEPDYFEEYYIEALKTICTGERDYRHWKNLMRQLLQDKITDKLKGGTRENYETIQLVKPWIHILKNLEEEDQLEELYENVYHVNSELCLDFARWLRDKDREGRAIEIIEGCLQESGRSNRTDLLELIVDLFEGRDPEKYVLNLMKLYKDKPNQKYYRKLKDATPDEKWSWVRKWLEEQLYGYELIDFYLREGDDDTAFEEVIESENLRVMQHYIDELGDYDSEKYFEVYGDLISSFLAEDTGRRHYRDAINHLRELNKLDLSDRLKELVERLKEENDDRPAFLDEISSFTVF
ncbi:MAG: SWIM zinc finger domain-containing protein [Candidatus Bipolaricaulia bacterium]